MCGLSIHVVNIDEFSALATTRIRGHPFKHFSIILSSRQTLLSLANV